MIPIALRVLLEAMNTNMSVYIELVIRSELYCAIYGAMSRFGLQIHNFLGPLTKDITSFVNG